MIIVGIDQSLTSTGIVARTENKILPDRFEIFSSQKTLSDFDRAWSISESVLSFINEINPTIVVVEGLAFGGSGNATRQLAGLQYLIVTKIKHVYQPEKLIVVSPITLKKAVTKNARANKQQMIESLPEEVYSLFSQKFNKTNGLSDLTDAYWLTRIDLWSKEKHEILQ